MEGCQFKLLTDFSLKFFFFFLATSALAHLIQFYNTPSNDAAEVSTQSLNNWKYWNELSFWLSGETRCFWWWWWWWWLYVVVLSKKIYRNWLFCVSWVISVAIQVFQPLWKVCTIQKYTKINQIIINLYESIKFIQIAYKSIWSRAPNFWESIKNIREDFAFHRGGEAPSYSLWYECFALDGG